MKSYDWYFIDIDDTLTDDKESKRGAFKEACTMQKEEYTDDFFEKFMKFENKFWQDWDEGKIKLPSWIKNREQEKHYVRAQRFIYIFNLELEEAIEINKHYCNKLAENIVPIEGVIDFVKYISLKSRLAVTTNGPVESVSKKIKKLGLLDKFEHMIIADNVGTNKPSIKFWNIAMETVSCFEPSKIAIIGDSLYSDMSGAVALGIDNYWFNHRDEPNPNGINVTFEFKTIKELYSVII